MKLLDGHDPAAGIGLTLELLTVTAAGRPQVALLSVGEVLALTPTRWRMAVYRGTNTAGALARPGAPAMVTMVHGGAHYRHELSIERTWQVRVRDQDLLAVEARLDGIVVDVADYATLVSGLVYRLTAPQAAVVDRWIETINALRTEEAAPE